MILHVFGMKIHVFKFSGIEDLFLVGLLLDFGLF